MFGDMARHYPSPWLFDRKYSMTFTTPLQVEFPLDAFRGLNRIS